MITLEVEPSLVRVLDSTVGLARVIAENRSGRDWASVRLKGSDPERIVRVSLASSELHVPPGGQRKPTPAWKRRCPTPAPR